MHKQNAISLNCEHVCMNFLFFHLGMTLERLQILHPPQQRHVKSESNCEAKWFGKWTADRPKLP